MPDLNDAPDLDATVPVAGPTPSAGSTPRLTVNLPLPEDLAKLLPEGTYTVQGFLGQGGMGAVYRGTQVRLQRQVAIKIMCRDQGRDHGFEERFRREALALAQLNHPNIVNVIDYGEAGPDYLYIVMEFVDGTDLVGVIRSGQMTQETALKLLPQICDALQFAHDNGIVHRDIKPANILLTRDGRIKMADFGLAKRFDVNSSFHTQTGAGMGTPDYAAPEQFDPNGNVDHRADIYALGVMIYQMVTGQLPRGAWKPPSEKADVDAHWDKIVSHALQTDPSDRYASVSEIKTDISSILLPVSGQGDVTGNAVSRKSGFSGKPGGSTTVLTQAGGRSAAVVQEPVPSRSKKPLVFGLAGTLVLSAAVGFLMWKKEEPVVVEPVVPFASRTWPPPARTVTVGTEWTNLIPHIKPERDAIRGEWAVDEKGLHAKRMPWALCNIPVQDPGTDYDLRYKVTRGEGSHLAMFCLFRKGDTGGMVPVDYVDGGKVELGNGMRVVGLESVQNTMFRPSSGWKKEWLPRGKACTVVLQVREKEVRLTVDDVEALRWQADWSQIRQRPSEDHPMFKGTSGSSIFGVGIYDCEATFHSIEMRKVSAAPFGEPGSIPHLLTSPDFEWSAPVNLGPLVNSPNVDLGPMVSPDGLHLVFSSLREGEAELFECRRPGADEPWSTPSRVFPAIEEGHQDQPWMSPDELRLIYHATTGPGHRGKPTEGDIYFRQRPTRDQPWQPPVNLGSKINHPGHDVAARLSNDERTLLFTSTRPGGRGIWDVWRATRTSREALFGQAENVGSDINTEESDFHATFAADDRTLLFLRGSRDLNFCRLFMATPNAKGQYQTTALDFPITGKLHNPWLSADGRTLWFAWNGPGSVGDMDLWEIRRVPKAKRESAAAGGSSITPANTSQDAPFTNTLGMKFVPVPITGGPTDGKRVLFSVWETRVQDYEAFVKDTKRAWSKPNFEQAPDHPAVDMSWDDATAFCAWLTDREHKAGKLGAASRYRLPTDHEWSCAVGIAPQEDAAKSPAQKDRALVGLYPWGTAWPPPVNSGNYAGEEMIPAKVPGRHPSASPCMGYRDAHVETAPAGSFPANALGLHDLGGSVWEWCEDWYDDSKAEHVLRGCAYIAGDQGRMLSSARNPYRPTAARSIYFGFRCVLVLSEGN